MKIILFLSITLLTACGTKENKQPINFTAGVALTKPENGDVEYSNGRLSIVMPDTLKAGDVVCIPIR